MNAPDKNSPLVSVCIPTYNYANFLPQAIESVLKQTIQDFELIVVDDASTDATDEVMARYTDDPRVTYVRNETNRGLFKNFNYSASLAAGKHLKFLCADDWLAPDYLARTTALLEANPELGLVTNTHVFTSAEGRPQIIEYAPFGGREVIPRQEVVDQLISWHYPLGRPTNVLIRRDVFEQVGGFDEQFAPTGDLQLWLRVLEHFDVGCVREPLCFVRSHQSKTHAFEDDPTAMVFTVWRDAAENGSLVDARRLNRACKREATRCTVFAIDAALHGRGKQARHVMAYVWPNVSRWRFPFYFVSQVPRIAHNFVSRIRAARQDRLLLIEGTASLGPAISESGLPVD